MRRRALTSAAAHCCQCDSDVTPHPTATSASRVSARALQNSTKSTMAPFTLITELPAHISPEEHQNIVASTPSSFASIPPVLRHKEENVSVTIDPPLEGFPSEDLVSGTLYVIERCVWYIGDQYDTD